MLAVKMSSIPVADLGFPRGGGANSPGGGGGRQHTILPKFPKNCMKLKEFGPPGGAHPKFYYVDPPLHSSFPVIHKIGNVVIFVLLRGEG